MQIPLIFYLYYFVLSKLNLEVYAINATCKSYRESENIDVLNIVGTWVTAYIQPRSVDCFILHIRATTDIERESCSLKYGNFNGSVDWSKCLLEIDSPLGKHYLQGNGNRSGLLENVIIIDSGKGKYELHKQNADQWSIFGGRGGELLLMTDCLEGAAAIFVRACYWPVEEELHAVLHRASVSPLTANKMFCEPLDNNAQRLLQHYFNKRLSRG